MPTLHSTTHTSLTRTGSRGSTQQAREWQSSCIQKMKGQIYLVFSFSGYHTNIMPFSLSWEQRFGPRKLNGRENWGLWTLGRQNQREDWSPCHQDTLFQKPGSVATDGTCQWLSILAARSLIVIPCGQIFGECTANVWKRIYKLHTSPTVQIYVMYMTTHYVHDYYCSNNVPQPIHHLAPSLGYGHPTLETLPLEGQEVWVTFLQETNRKGICLRKIICNPRCDPK